MLSRAVSVLSEAAHLFLHSSSSFSPWFCFCSEIIIIINCAGGNYTLQECVYECVWSSCPAPRRTRWAGTPRGARRLTPPSHPSAPKGGAGEPALPPSPRGPARRLVRGGLGISVGEGDLRNHWIKTVGQEADKGVLTSAKSDLRVGMRQFLFRCLDSVLIKESLVKYCNRSGAFPFLSKNVLTNAWVRKHLLQ